MNKKAKKNEQVAFTLFLKRVLTPLDSKMLEDSKNNQSGTVIGTVNKIEMIQYNLGRSKKQMEGYMSKVSMGGVYEQSDGVKRFNPHASLIEMSEQERMQWREKDTRKKEKKLRLCGRMVLIILQKH